MRTIPELSLVMARWAAVARFWMVTVAFGTIAPEESNSFDFESAGDLERDGAGVGLVGEEADLTYAYDYLGAGPETLVKIADGSHPFLKKLEGIERPMLILGQAALARPDGAAVLALAAKAALAMGALKPALSWNGFNVLHTAAARVAGLDLGLVPAKGGLDVESMLEASAKGKIEVLYLLGADGAAAALADGDQGPPRGVGVLRRGGRPLQDRRRRGAGAA